MESLNTFFQSAPKLHLSWTNGPLSFSDLNPLPRTLRRHARKRSRGKEGRREGLGLTPTRLTTPPTDITKLQTSFNPYEAVESLRTHRWRWTDVQYGIIAILMIFSLAIAPMPWAVRLLVPPLALLTTLMPATRQFFLPSMGIWVYLLYFFTSRYIPTEYRPHIWVKVLPALENILYGANISNILSAHTHPVLDVLAWIPYGIGHFASPFICSAFMFIYAAPGTTPVFARCFGWLAIVGVTIALVFPCTPPWYERTTGLDVPAEYGMPGSPAGLARVDQLFGTDLYTTSFTTAPVPFGAFPSLHAANAVLHALFMSRCFPRLQGFFVAYVFWLWWATMYLNHHYAVDLVGGSLIATGIFFYARARYLPRQQADKRNRWQYEFVEIGDKAQDIDEEYNMLTTYEPGYGLGVLGQPDDEDVEIGARWLAGRRSSGSTNGSTSIGLSHGSAATTPTALMSPSDSDRSDSQRSRRSMQHPRQSTTTLGMTPHGQLWEGESGFRDSDLAEVVIVR